MLAVAERPVNGEVDVVYSAPEEFSQIALEWLTEGVQFLAGDISDEILAASRWSEYRAERVERVFEALAPILPPGMPEFGELVRPGAPGVPEIRVPYLLSIRDAAEYHRSDSSASSAG